MASALVVLNDRTAGVTRIVAEAGHQVFEVHTSGEALQGVIRRKPDLIILPEDVQPVEGVDLLPVIRGLTASPIIVVGSGDPTSMAKALMEGADAYIKYPLDDRSLRSRIRSLLRRSRERRLASGGDRPIITVEQESEVQRCMKVLSPKEGEILRLLLQRLGALVPADQIMETVWGEKTKDTSLRFYIRQLRAKLQPFGMFFIQNQKGIGYRLELRPSPGFGGGL